MINGRTWVGLLRDALAVLEHHRNVSQGYLLDEGPAVFEIVNVAVCERVEKGGGRLPSWQVDQQRTLRLLEQFGLLH